MRRLNVVSAVTDRELDALRHILVGFETASDLGDLETSLRSHLRAGRCVDQVDLIGHTVHGGLLVLGSWILDDSSRTASCFRYVLRPVLAELGVRTIRLLGCSTAVNPRSRRTIEQIAWASGCVLFGTTQYVSNSDYDGAGFASEHALVRIHEGKALWT